jgi:hypothetical protein
MLEKLVQMVCQDVDKPRLNGRVRLGVSSVVAFEMAFPPKAAEVELRILASSTTSVDSTTFMNDANDPAKVECTLTTTCYGCPNQSRRLGRSAVCVTNNPNLHERKGAWLTESPDFRQQPRSIES